MTVWNSRGHRGDALEDLIVLTNDFYKSKKLGRVDKIHVPIKVIEINNNGIITKAFFEKKSTVDFTGLIQGVGIAFDTKETTLKSLPLQNIHDHQIEFMKDIDDQSGLSFLIVHFKFCDEYFLVPYEMLCRFISEATRKSIPYTSMIPELKIERTSNGILNYLDVLNVYVNLKNSNTL